jgi:uncharacterized protein (TIRG00374 family)
MSVLPSVFRTLLAVVLSVALVWVFLRNADLARVWDAMRGARLDLVGVAVLITILTHIVRTERWQYLLEPLGPTRFGVAFRATVIGFAVSAVLPARAGEVLRPYLLARREGLSATATFATIVIERVLDLMGVLALLAVYLVAFDPGMAARDSALFEAIRVGGLVMAPLAAVALATMFVLAGHPGWLQAWLAAIDRILPARLAGAIGRLVRRFSAGFGVLRRPARLAASLAWTFVLWLVICAETWVIAEAFDIDMSFAGSWLMAALLVVGVAVPTPGGVGGFHEAFRLGATAFFGADNDAAVGAAIVLHATSFLPVTILGGWYALREGLNPARMRQMTREPVEVEAGA